MNRTHPIPPPGPILLLAVIGISSASILIRWSAAPALTIAFYRLGYAAAIHAAISLANRNGYRAFDRWAILRSILAGCFLAAHFGLWITSLGYTTVAASTVLVSFHPLLTAAGGFFLFREKLSSGALAAMLVGLFGTGIIAFGGGLSVGTGSLGAGLALLGALAMSGYLLAGRAVRRRVGTIPYTVVVYAVAAASVAAVAQMRGIPLVGFPLREHLIFVALAVFPTLFGHTLLNWALAHVQTAGVSFSALGEPVVATLLAWLLLREVPAAHQIVGGLVVLVALGTYLRRVSSRRRRGAIAQ